MLVELFWEDENLRVLLIGGRKKTNTLEYMIPADIEYANPKSSNTVLETGRT